MSGPFEGQVAVITGAARGLGLDYARRLAADGATVVLADVDEAGASKGAGEISSAGGRAIALACDVTDPDASSALAARVVSELGRIDVLVNNAGIWGDLEAAEILDIQPDYWDFVMGVNVKGCWLCTRAVAPQMREQGRGRIINMSSIGSRMASGVYGVSKLALNQLTWTTAAALGDHGVTVNAVAPGPIYNEATQRQVAREHFDRLIEQTMIKRAGTGKDMYGAIRWLASDDAEWVTGQTIYVNGGFMGVF